MERGRVVAMYLFSLSVQGFIMEVIGAGVLVKKEAMHYTLYISTRGAMIDCESSSVYVWMKLKLRAQNLCVYLKKCSTNKVKPLLCTCNLSATGDKLTLRLNRDHSSFSRRTGLFSAWVDRSLRTYGGTKLSYRSLELGRRGKCCDVRRVR